jgi:hypothetical protein
VSPQLDFDRHEGGRFRQDSGTHRQPTGRDGGAWSGGHSTPEEFCWQFDQFFFFLAHLAATALRPCLLICRSERVSSIEPRKVNIGIEVANGVATTLSMKLSELIRQAFEGAAGDTFVIKAGEIHSFRHEIPSHSQSSARSVCVMQQNLEERYGTAATADRVVTSKRSLRYGAARQTWLQHGCPRCSLI